MTQGGRLRIDAAPLADFLEALYRWDASEEDWLRGLCAPLLRVVPSGLWVQANTYDASGRAFVCPTIVTHRAPPMLGEQFRLQSARFTPEIIARCYFATSVSTVPSPPADVQRETGAAAVLAVKGLDPSGRSAALNVGLPDMRTLGGGALALLQRVSGHISSAARVRRRISASAGGPAAPTSGADAVFSPERGGRLVHAEAGAKARVHREQLTRALRLRESARAKKRRDELLDSWRPLVDTRWTLVDAYESDGVRYVVARENHADVHSLDALTQRERQVVASLAFGETTKEVAYALGIDASTARVLLKRAAKKLGVAGRAALLDHPSVKAMRGGLDAAELNRIRAAR